MQKKWYENSVIMTFLGVCLGAVIGFFGTIYSSHVQIEAIEIQHEYEMEQRSIERREETYSEILQSIYSLQKMNDGLIEIDLVSFKNDCYTLMAEAKIFGSEEVVKLYDQFLTVFFEEQIYDGELVDNQLISAIRKDLNVTP